MNKKNCTNFLVGTLCILFLLLVFSLVAVFYGGVMSCFGFEYRSLWSLLLFFMVTGFITFPVEALYTYSIKQAINMEKISQTKGKILFCLFDFISNFLAMVLVEHVMDSISANLLGFATGALLFSLTSVGDIKKTPNLEEILADNPEELLQ